jgi:hypothetical protein
MSYRREIPRDLFNEASLLKCLGHLSIKLETAGAPKAELIGPRIGEGFIIDQDQASGSISCLNAPLMLRGERCVLSRPLNSREPWPLWLEAIGIETLIEEIEVFTQDGELSDEFLAAIREPG